MEGLICLALLVQQFSHHVEFSFIELEFHSLLGQREEEAKKVLRKMTLLPLSF